MSADPSIQQLARNDQMTTELNDTIGRVCIAYKMMINVGVPEADAAQMAADYNRRVLNRHFGVQMFAMNEVYMDMDGGDE